jgi:hypothetical protein
MRRTWGGGRAEIIHLTIMLSLYVLCERLHKQCFSMLCSGLPIVTVLLWAPPAEQSKTRTANTAVGCVNQASSTHHNSRNWIFIITNTKAHNWPTYSTSSIHLTSPQFISQNSQNVIFVILSQPPQIQKSFRIKILHALSPYILKYPH